MDGQQIQAETFDNGDGLSTVIGMSNLSCAASRANGVPVIYYARGDRWIVATRTKSVASKVQAVLGGLVGTVHC